MKVRKILLVILILAMLFSGCSQKSHQIKNAYTTSKNLSSENLTAMGIARKVKSLYESAKTVKGFEHLVVVSNGKTFVDDVLFVIKKPDKIWMYDLTHNAYLVSNGTYTWIYDKGKNTVTVEKSRPSHPPDYARYIEGLGDVFNVSYSGTKNVSGIRCYVLRLTPNGSTNTEVYGYMYVTPEYKVSELYFRLENTVYDMKFLNVTYNASINDSLFSFKIPKNAKVYRVIEKLKIGCYTNISEAQKYLPFKLLLPEYTAGYKFQRVCLYGAKALLEYVNGANEMLVMETVVPLAYPSSARNVSIGNLTAHVWSKEGRTHVVFSVNGVYIEVSSPMNVSETLKVCESII